jgi:hypothetical protein
MQQAKLSPVRILQLKALFESTSLAGDAADTNSLRVVVIPSKTEVRVQEKFKVALRVENPTTINQTVRVWSCSWDEEWKTSNTTISWIDWDCTRNFPENIEIPPGGAYTNELEMLIPEPISKNMLSFRMGFTPIDSQATIWSNRVKLNVLPSRKAKANLKPYATFCAPISRRACAKTWPTPPTLSFLSPICPNIIVNCDS